MADEERSVLRLPLGEHTLAGLAAVVRKAERAGIPDEADVVLGRKNIEFRWDGDLVNDEDTDEPESGDDGAPADF
jgi:hypothetical protein